MASELTGVAALVAQLRELGSPKEQAQALRASVTTPMNRVKAVARQNIAAISPGEADLHRTYKGRLVSAGFASRSLRVETTLSKDKQSATARLGVRREAFYAVQFFELGTAHIPRQPWLVPAFESSQSESLRLVGETLKKRILKIAAKRNAG
jgi:hypothetical protein